MDVQCLVFFEDDRVLVGEVFVGFYFDVVFACGQWFYSKGRRFFVDEVTVDGHVDFGGGRL